MERSDAHRLEFTEAELHAARAFNAKLARMPRFRIRNRFTPLLYQSLLRLSQVGVDRRTRRRGVTVERRRVGWNGQEVAVRILRPRGPVRGVVLDVHGGGWAIGNAAMDDDLNLGLIAACGVTVVSVDYRLVGARSTLQAAMDDCFAAAAWLLRGEHDLRGLPVVLVGESAGGHLGAATLLRVKAELGGLERFAGALLYYGVYDLAGTPSVRAAGRDTLVLDGRGMLGAMRLLTPDMDDAARRQAPLSPLFGDLAGMPPALMAVGELDPLLDDTVAMAERWGATAAVELHRVPEAPHGFIRFPTPLAEKMLARSRAWVRERLAAY
ncbi:alpha/beta hydrolase [Sphingomonas sp. IC-56]|uniref:alpha/beta hydrolase n=1 Tax=Sphingomonas sp. IC-56 TaxID=2898529 RepID=UPI001E2BC4D2|nr:alpha/beta hydrolase [Sphingomonas sp. IC-56]MCD2323004.1 alpha/beta hydrolase [Sphingomonas sp. IC-56]